jgi:peptidoglycan/LPS O-acetylase OafA/YrhL
MTHYATLPRSSGEDESNSSDSESSMSVEPNESQLEQDLSEKLTSHFRTPFCQRRNPGIRWLFVRQLRIKLRMIGLAILPSYISHRVAEKKPVSKNSHNLASLEGLRGVACLLVLNQHFSYNYSRAFLEGWNGKEGRRWIVQLPIIRLLCSGNAMVAIFFVISEYVLSYKPLRHMQRNPDRVSRTINSAIVRRGIRLYLPAFIATFMCMLLVQAGAFERGREAYKNGRSLLTANEDSPRRFDTFFEQLWHWWETAVLKMLYPWTWQDTWQNYDPHLWTIPTEFRCSMLLFLIHCGISRFRPNFRVAFLGFITFYCAWADAEQITLFLAGMFIVQIDTIVQSRTDTKPWPPFVSAKGRKISTGSVKRTAWIVTFIAGLCLASTPSVNSEDSTGYSYLVRELVPRWYRVRHYFWQSVGAIMIVSSALHSDDIQPIFTNPFAQYLERSHTRCFLFTATSFAAFCTESCRRYGGFVAT